MYSIDLRGKTALVFGVANQRSIAWFIAQKLSEAGARLVITDQNERLKENAIKLTKSLESPVLLECDVQQPGHIENVFKNIENKVGGLDILIHSIAYANREDLGGEFSKTTKEGFLLALEISAYSLIPIVRNATPLLSKQGGTVVSMTFQASEKVFPGYNVMGTAKAALENEVKQLAYEVGEQGVRVNAISAGPVDTLSSRVIKGYVDMKKAAAERSPLRKNISLDDIAGTALYLSSDLSSGVTGEIIHVDAGYNIMGI